MIGRVWKFGDDINTDIIVPGIYIKLPPKELATHCLESVDKDFAGNVCKGDIIVAGTNFGMGSSREQAVQVLKILGVGAIVAKSFGGIFYRNAFNVGLPAIVSRDISKIESCQSIELDLEIGHIINRSTGEKIITESVPDNLQVYIKMGGLVPYLESIITKKD